MFETRLSFPPHQTSFLPSVVLPSYWLAGVNAHKQTRFNTNQKLIKRRTRHSESCQRFTNKSTLWIFSVVHRFACKDASHSREMFYYATIFGFFLAIPSKRLRCQTAKLLRKLSLFDLLVGRSHTFLRLAALLTGLPRDQSEAIMRMNT